MLNYISEHLHSDEQKQKQLEADLASSLKSNFNRSINAFLKHIPTLGEQLKQFRPHSTSVFVNKYAQLNIVNFTTGNVLYPVDCDRATANQIACWEQRSVAYDLSNASAMRMDGNDLNDLGIQHFAKIKDKQHVFDTLILLGIGSGKYIIDLIKAFQLKFLLMYEPNWQLLYCSLSICDWREIFDYCQAHNITIFIQTSTEFENDLKELASSTDGKHALIYQHLHTRDFDAFVRDTRFNMRALTEHEKQCAELEIWQPAANLKDWKRYDEHSTHLKSNIAALKQYYPGIADVFSTYTPALWLPVKHRQSGEVSLFNRYSCTIYSPSPHAEAQDAFNAFCNYPNREQLFMGYLGNKLNHFAFNHFYTEIGAVLASQEQARSVLPDTLALLIIFGLGNAYTLNTISAQKDLKHLFIVEPNPDFFYWSLLVADWSTIFSNIIDKEGQMYLNIGQLNEGLSGELTRQYAFIGNHHVAKTWIYQGYNTPSLNLYLNKVRGTFKTLFSISDNFNHCFYSLEHFLYSVENAFGYMTKTVNAESKKYGHVPVFMVGNGPSVDSCIEQLREYQDQAIIVSCGTTLKTLYNCGIVPDYHAEVESYRANYDWITQIPDPEYLSKITLISPDGIHPDNTKLFKNTLFALKNGESATVIHRYLFPDHDFVVLSEAYPTVSNFCLTFFIHAGFQEIYLLGVDLGYIDPDRHHGQNSSYYENNKTLYTVAKDENSVLSVVGNFLPTVLTKHEFNLARSVMEQALAKANIDCYNTSNGAKIAGAIPLLPQDIMVLTSEADKQQALCRFEGAFTPLSDEFMHRYEAVFQPSQLSDRIFSMAEQLPAAFDCVTEIDTLVKSHERVLREDKSNLLVLALLPSTIQCFFAALIKTSLVADAEIALQNANHILSAYRELLFKSAHLTKNTSDRWDISVAFIERREQRLLQAKPLTLAIEDKHAGESLNDIIRPDHIVIEGWKDESFSSDIFVINDMHRLDTLRAAVDQQVELDGLILTFDIAIADAAQKICVTTPKLAALYYDLSDYLSLAQQGQKEHAQDINLPLIEFIETSLQARFSQRIDFSAMYYKPRFDMQPHIRKLSTDPSHPANWQQVVDMLEAINQHDIKVIFKHFIAITRPCDEKASGRDDAKLDGTILDTFENRGMQVERRIYPMEVLDYCYISSNHHQIAACIQECLSRV